MRSKLTALVMAVVLVGMLGIVPFAAPTFAQDSTNTSQSTSGNSSKTTTATTSTSTTNPVQTTQPGQSTRVVTSNTTTVDPIWIVVGGLALLAILVIAILAMRGRSHDRVAVHERETVIKR